MFAPAYSLKIYFRLFHCRKGSQLIINIILNLVLETDKTQASDDVIYFWAIHIKGCDLRPVLAPTHELKFKGSSSRRGGNNLCIFRQHWAPTSIIL